MTYVRVKRITAYGLYPITTIYRAWFGVFNQTLYKYSIRWTDFFIPGALNGMLAATTDMYSHWEGKYLFHQEYDYKK